MWVGFIDHIFNCCCNLRNILWNLRDWEELQPVLVSHGCVVGCTISVRQDCVGGHTMFLYVCANHAWAPRELQCDAHKLRELVSAVHLLVASCFPPTGVCYMLFYELSTGPVALSLCHLDFTHTNSKTNAMNSVAHFLWKVTRKIQFVIVSARILTGVRCQSSNASHGSVAVADNLFLCTVHSVGIDF